MLTLFQGATTDRAQLAADVLSRAELEASRLGGTQLVLCGELGDEELVWLRASGFTSESNCPRGCVCKPV